MRYALINDDDGHWYVCPEERLEEASSYLEKVADYWRDMSSDSGLPDEPLWLENVGGAPSRVRFPDYEIT